MRMNGIMNMNEVYRSKRDEYERHASLIDFFSTLDIRFYNECFPQPGCSIAMENMV